MTQVITEALLPPSKIQVQVITKTSIPSPKIQVITKQRVQKLPKDTIPWPLDFSQFNSIDELFDKDAKTYDEIKDYFIHEEGAEYVNIFEGDNYISRGEMKMIKNYNGRVVG